MKLGEDTVTVSDINGKHLFRVNAIEYLSPVFHEDGKDAYFEVTVALKEPVRLDYETDSRAKYQWRKISQAMTRKGQE